MKYYSEETVKLIINDTVKAVLHTEKPTTDYPCIEFPNEHGRLIVADALLEKLEKIALPDDLTYTIAHGILKQIIEDAETIVEATE